METNDPRVILGLAFLLLLAAGGVIWLWQARRQRRLRETLAGRPLSLRQRVILEKPLPWIRRLPDDLRRSLEGAMQLFLAETRFEACGGLPEVTEEMRLVIAAQACLLVANRPDAGFGRLHTVLVYPGAFQVPVSQPLGPDFEWVDEEEERLGESWEQGSVIIAWDSVLRGSPNHEDGLNVVLHEFAHQLDQANGAADGAPILARAADYASWAKVFHAAYGRHVEDTRENRASVLDEYAAEDPAEFFAVATETFFERPAALAAEYPELFAELRKFYRLNPRDWHPEPTGRS